MVSEQQARWEDMLAEVLRKRDAPPLPEAVNQIIIELMDAAYSIGRLDNIPDMAFGKVDPNNRLVGHCHFCNRRTETIPAWSLPLGEYPACAVCKQEKRR